MNGKRRAILSYQTVRSLSIDLFNSGLWSDLQAIIVSSMKLFKYEGCQVTISEEAFALKVFRDVWDRDKSDDKHRAKQELGWIYFMCDPRSDYVDEFIDEEQRSLEIIRGEGMKETWKPDIVVYNAKEFYEKFKTSSVLLLEETKLAMDKLRKYIKEIDLHAVDDSGKPLFSVDTYVKILDKLPELIRKLDESERAVRSEIAAAERVKGKQEKSLFEDE